MEVNGVPKVPGVPEGRGSGEQKRPGFVWVIN